MTNPREAARDRVIAAARRVIENNAVKGYIPFIYAALEPLHVAIRELDAIEAAPVEPRKHRFCTCDVGYVCDRCKDFASVLADERETNTEHVGVCDKRHAQCAEAQRVFNRHAECPTCHGYEGGEFCSNSHHLMVEREKQEKKDAAYHAANCPADCDGGAEECARCEEMK